jgi:hypothetical protein
MNVAKHLLIDADEMQRMTIARSLLTEAIQLNASSPVADKVPV